MEQEKLKNRCAHALSMSDIRVYVLHLNQDDPKKCTAKKLARFGYVSLFYTKKNIPKGSLILSPFSNRAVSPLDAHVAERRGLTVVDCSWKHARVVFQSLRGNFRRLPFLVPVNPTNYGHPGQLSSAEALAAALHILGYNTQAQKIMGIFKWGLNFFVMNREPLELYSQANSPEEIEKYEAEFYP